MKMVNLGIEGHLDKEPEKRKQVCIPVGCVPAAHRPYSGVCLPRGGVCLVRGRDLPWGGSAWSEGGILPGPGGFSLVWRGVCLVRGGFSLVRGGSACPGARVLPSWRPHRPVNRITDTCKNITLATTSLRPVNIFFPEVFLSVTDSSRKVLSTDYFSPHLNY